MIMSPISIKGTVSVKNIFSCWSELIYASITVLYENHKYHALNQY